MPFNEIKAIASRPPCARADARLARGSKLIKPLIWLIIVGLALHLSACTGPENQTFDRALLVGILPDESVEALRERYAPLLEFLSQETGLAYELAIPGSYSDLLRQFGAGQLDLAYFGGVTFLRASSEHGAIPLVMRDVDSRFTSAFIVAGDTATTLQETRGKRFSFGSRLSTSGHLMPRHFFQHKLGIAAEDFFSSIRYSGKHDRTAYWVRDGEVDVGVANSEIIGKMFADGRLQPGEVQIIWTSPPYVDYVWAAHPQISDVHRESIHRAFLTLSAENPQHEAILSGLGAASFYPARLKDFSILEKVLASSELMK